MITIEMTRDKPKKIGMYFLQEHNEVPVLYTVTKTPEDNFLARLAKQELASYIIKEEDWKNHWLWSKESVIFKKP